MCGSSSTCSGTSLNLGYVSGDSYSDVARATGSTSYWMKVVVGEDSWSGRPLRVRATLTSPPGTNYDLFIHTRSCSTATKSSTKLTGDDVISHSQPDATLGADDDYLVMIEVRHVSGTCSATEKWTLKVEGNR
ncbi:MAG: hypothetical protein KIT84_30120 [Labilithrix sp.]|nr:hypothetical protein [Labilithrix sp.]MCW5815321.1 hypothetical protein [Labilithrix sp.]